MAAGKATQQEERKMSSPNPNGSTNPAGASSNASSNASANNVAGNPAIPGATPETPGGQPAVANLQPETVQLTSAADRAREEQTRKAIIIASIVGVVMLVFLIGFIIFLASDAARTALIRDIVIILYAIGSLMMTIIIGILLVVLIYRIQDLIGFLRGELIPVISNVGNSINNVTGTVNLVSDNVAKPTIKVASMVAGLQQMAKTTTEKVRGGR
jgi:hypothetical protein